MNAFLNICYVYSLRVFCNLIGATSECESQILHKNGIRVKPDPPSVGGGAGKTD